MEEWISVFPDLGKTVSKVWKDADTLATRNRNQIVNARIILSIYLTRTGNSRAAGVSLEMFMDSYTGTFYTFYTFYMNSYTGTFYRHLL